MNKHKISKVLTSKSSNSTVTRKPDSRRNRTTNSNVEFQTSATKKRGVYVENKDDKLNMDVHVTAQSKKIRKPTPRPRPGKKCFVATVLKILSKSTVGTQYPDFEGVEDLKKYSKPNNNSKKKTINRMEPIKGHNRTKKKYKSRVLNQNADDEIVILQSRKEMINTPSTYSEQSRVDFKHGLKPILVQNINGVTSDKLLATAVLEGKHRKSEKVKIDNDDPPTLVADLNNKNDKKLYNFFVDLLGTTLSTCNLKEDCMGITAEVSTSKIGLEIRESVARRLAVNKSQLNADVNQIKTVKQDGSNNSIRYFQTTTNDEVTKMPIKRKIKSHVANHSRKLLTIPKFEHVASCKKPSRVSKKQSLLDSLKNQLMMEVKTYEEPQNIFRALKLIATNKRRYVKTLQFLKPKDEGNSCRFKRRKVISKSTRCGPNLPFKREMLKSNRTFRLASYSRNVNVLADSDRESHNSLQVYDFSEELDIHKTQTFENQIARAKSPIT